MSRPRSRRARPPSRPQRLQKTEFPQVKTMYSNPLRAVCAVQSCWAREPPRHTSHSLDRAKCMPTTSPTRQSAQVRRTGLAVLRTAGVSVGVSLPGATEQVCRASGEDEHMSRRSRWLPFAWGAGLAGAGAAVAFVLAGGPWAAGGAVIGAGAFAPSLYDGLRERRARHEGWRGTVEKALPQSRARLVDPFREVAGLGRRKTELAAWCHDDPRRAAAAGDRSRRGRQDPAGHRACRSDAGCWVAG